ncbi:NADP-dependent oxidoreductase domain-containing protein [Lobosporangium transversale]|uniref:NADP-dependent oxidoreductase domain-containing protein n=1 Tax=Lobosporangium transversale TaxID=64571 RepID=A0A1Y2GIW6_9FUNG|nr:NADP-dependent oxidoreductase domain-containing protein [Lobosporangium transversale]ORZ12142.1 NADP-dependent oxidoreductase domain-containing protein [Lobosporangium transversale]|eukprot:XP_021880007.1 NADP-dependent oxidoreductase domain-containing protein [Lobosporangium transversale]
MTTPKTTPRIILGTQSFALHTTDPKTADFRVQGPENLKPFLDLLETFGVLELDTARVYCGGDTEATIGLVEGEPLTRFEISTKVYPLQPGDHSPEALVRHLYQSLEQLKVDKVKIFYLHAPDFYTPFETTLKAIDDLYKDGLFDEFGLSNFAAWQVALIHQICHYKGYVKPTVYQGWYNPLMRQVERELFPCLRELGMKFYAYNPIAGGFLTGKYHIDSIVRDGTRFDTKTILGSYYREQYWSPLFFDAVDALRKVTESYGTPLLEASIRWMNHHSGLGPNDGLIFGANDCVGNLKENLISLQQGPLNKELVKAFEELWGKVKAANQTYFRRDIRYLKPEDDDVGSDEETEK